MQELTLGTKNVVVSHKGYATLYPKSEYKYDQQGETDP